MAVDPPRPADDGPPRVAGDETPPAAVARAAAELYAGSPDDFVARRKILATQARGAGDRVGAKAIEQLRRPTRNAWLVNLLAAEAPDEVAALLRLRSDLADAQARMAGDELRRLSQLRRTTVDGLARKAVRLGLEHDYTASESAVWEISQTLQAALGDPAVGRLLASGQLIQSITYGGFGLGSPATPDAPAAPDVGGSDLLAALAASIPRSTGGASADRSEPATDSGETPEPADDGAEALAEAADERDRVAEEERAAADRARSEARAQAKAEARARAETEARARAEAAAQAAAAQAAAQARQDELDQAESEAEDATVRADALSDRVEALKGELRDAEVAERAALGQARAARRRLSELRRTGVR